MYADIYEYENMYADDTSISFSSDSLPIIKESVNSDLLCLKAWLEWNQQSLNLAKTQNLSLLGRKKLKVERSRKL